MDWIVYGLICKRGSELCVYIGITNNWEKRRAAHFEGKGAKFTKSFPPIKGAPLLIGLNKSQALRMEAKYKKFSNGEKIKLIEKSIK